MAAKRKQKVVKAKKERGGPRKVAGRKSVEVHFASLHAKLDQMLEVMGVGSEPVKAPVQLATVPVQPVQHAASPVAAPQPPVAVPQPYQVSFVPPSQGQPVPMTQEQYEAQFNK